MQNLLKYFLLQAKTALGGDSMYLIISGIVWFILTIMLLVYALYNKYKPDKLVMVSGKIAQYFINASMMAWVGMTISLIYYFSAITFGGTCEVCRSGVCNI